VIHLDTHVAIWLAAGQSKLLRPVSALLRRETLCVSPVVLVEIGMLFEIGRIRHSAETVFRLLQSEHGVERVHGDLERIGDMALRLGWTRDPFDRLVVAHALEVGAELLTKDQTILNNFPSARWAS